MNIEKSGEVTINQVLNGYIITQTVWKDTSPNGEKIYSQECQVIEIAHDELGEVKAARDLLHVVNDLLGISYSKHNKHNITIDIDSSDE